MNTWARHGLQLRAVQALTLEFQDLIQVGSCWQLRVLKVTLVLRVLKDLRAQLVLRVLLELRVLLVLKVLLDLRVQLVLRVLLVHKATPVLKVLKDHKELREHGMTVRIEEYGQTPLVYLMQLVT